MVHSTTSVFCVTILQKWTLCQFFQSKYHGPIRIYVLLYLSHLTKIYDDDDGKAFSLSCNLVLSRLTATAPACCLLACLVIWGLSERVPATVPLCQPMSTAPATYTCSKVSYSVSSSQPEPRSHCHLPHTPSNAHIHFDTLHCQSNIQMAARNLCVGNCLGGYHIFLTPRCDMHSGSDCDIKLR